MQIRSSALVVASLFGLVALSSQLHAQPPPPDGAPPGAPPPSASATDQPAPAGPSEADVKKATDLFVKGSGLRDMKKYAPALEQFKGSYAAVPSPNSHLEIARCLEKLGQVKEAYIEYAKVITEAEARREKYADALEAAKADREALAGKIGLVTVNVTNGGPGLSLKVGGVEVPQEDWGKPVPVMPGEATEVTLEGAPKPLSESVSLKAGEQREVTFDAKPVAEAPPPAPVEPPKSSKAKLRMYSYVAGGVGVFGLGMFTIAGIMANSTYSDLEEACGGPCPPDREDDISSGKTQQTVANVGLVLGILGAAGGVTLFMLSREPKQDAAPPAAAVYLGPGLLGVRGTY